MTYLFIPTSTHIDNLKVGDQVINCFGKFAEVVEINYRGVDAEGRKFVGFYTSTGGTGSVSGSLKEGRLVRHAAIPMTSAQIDRIEEDMLMAGENMRSVA